jgi:PKD repeat protein
LPFARLCCAVAEVLVPRAGSVLFGTVLALGVLTACAGGELMLPPAGSGEPAAIRVLNADALSGQAGEMLTTPVVVEVTDASGQPVENATVVFALTSAGEGGEITPDTTSTDSAGHAEASLLLGDKIGLQTGEARVVVQGTVPPRTTFTALASAPSLGNRSPVADFNWHCDVLSCQFTNASRDDDGRVTGWSWQFGDGGTSGEVDPAHNYFGPGTYTVTLTVTDDDGATDQKTAHVDVTAPALEDNKAPQADFDDHCHDLSCSFTDKSKDDDGSVVSWVWDFGDGTGSNEQNPTHSYEEEGHYEVTLTVTDNDGATDTEDHHADARD